MKAFIHNWKPLMWLAPNIFRTDVSLMTGTFPYLSTVSLAPFFKSTLSQGHLPLCDMHTHNHAIFGHFLSPFCQLNLDRPHLTSWGQFIQIGLVDSAKIKIKNQDQKAKGRTLCPHRTN